MGKMIKILVQPQPDLLAETHFISIQLDISIGSLEYICGILYDIIGSPRHPVIKTQFFLGLVRLPEERRRQLLVLQDFFIFAGPECREEYGVQCTVQVQRQASMIACYAVAAGCSRVTARHPAC